jgi:hypothetical protein
MSRIYVSVENVPASPFQVSVAPLPSLNRALRSAASAGASNGTPQAWSDAIRTNLRGTTV